MLQRGTLAFLTLLSLNSFAGNFEYLPAGSAPEKEFQALMESGNYRKALPAWNSQSHAFAQTQTGIATWAYIMYQNGLPYTALETLMLNTQPGKIDPQILKMWSPELKTAPYIQKGWIATTGGWKALFNNEKITLKLKNKKDIAKAFAKASALAAEKTNEKARILWQIATKAPLINEVEPSLQALKQLRDLQQIVVAPDMLALAQGHVLYQKGDLEGAVAAYKQIPKSSNLWLDSVEERAWTHLRQSDYDKAVGDITTALSPVLAPLAGPESYFLGNLMAYRVCDYSRIFNTSEAFKARHRLRLAAIQDLAQKGTNASLGEVFDRFDSNGVNAEAAGPKIESIPRTLIRDVQFIRLMESRRALLSEFKRSAQLAESGTAPPELEKFTAVLRPQAAQFKQAALQRTRALAQTDLREYRVILNKMHIIEAEVIQRLHMDDNMKGQRNKLSKTDDKGDVLVFPYTKEVWMDELDNYQARVKDCPTLKGASLD